jgi:hypothetical protein
MGFAPELQQYLTIGRCHAAHVPGSDRIRDPLIAQRFDQPVKQGRGVVVSDGANDATPSKVGANVVDIRR